MYQVGRRRWFIDPFLQFLPLDIPGDGRKGLQQEKVFVFRGTGGVGDNFIFDDYRLAL